MKQESNKLDRNSQWRSRQLLKVCLLPMVMAACWAGCKEPAKVSGEINPAGTYTLVSVDGKEVPCSVQHDGHALAVKSGTFVINADGTCSSRIAFAPPSGNEVVREVKANYTRQGVKLTMKWEKAGTTIGTVAGDTFTMNNEGMIFAYRR